MGESHPRAQPEAIRVTDDTESITIARLVDLFHSLPSRTRLLPFQVLAPVLIILIMYR
jgi:hypothetical protein